MSGYIIEEEDCEYYKHHIFPTTKLEKMVFEDAPVHPTWHLVYHILIHLTSMDFLVKYAFFKSENYIINFGYRTASSPVAIWFSNCPSFRTFILIKILVSFKNFDSTLLVCQSQQHSFYISHLQKHSRIFPILNQKCPYLYGLIPTIDTLLSFISLSYQKI